MCSPSCLFKGDNGGRGGELLLHIIETNKREKIKDIYRKDEKNEPRTFVASAIAKSEFIDRD